MGILEPNKIPIISPQSASHKTISKGIRKETINKKNKKEERSPHIHIYALSVYNITIVNRGLALHYIFCMKNV